MLWRISPRRSRRTPPAGFILPCQPLLVDRPPIGQGWLHEVKHDGYRIIACKEGSRVTLWTRHGTNFTDRLPKIAEAVCSLAADSALIDGEAVAFRSDGHSDFAALRTKAGSARACLVAFDLLNLQRRGFRSASDRGTARCAFTSRRRRRRHPCSARPYRPRERSCSPRPASWVWRGSCRNAPAADMCSANETRRQALLGGRGAGHRGQLPAPLGRACLGHRGAFSAIPANGGRSKIALNQNAPKTDGDQRDADPREQLIA
jgi:hypothetical protein